MGNQKTHSGGVTSFLLVRPTLISLGLTYSGFDDIFRDGLNCVIGNGEEILFWKSQCHGQAPFQDVFPELFRMAVHWNITVAGAFQSSSQ